MLNIEIEADDILAALDAIQNIKQIYNFVQIPGIIRSEFFITSKVKSSGGILIKKVVFLC
jgi:hypothetical protein